MEDTTTTAEKTSQLLEQRGWCLWKCDALGGAIITVMRDNFKPTFEEEKTMTIVLGKIFERFPETVNQEWPGCPYTVKELAILGESDNAWLLHQAKLLGATILKRIRK